MGNIGRRTFIAGAVATTAGMKAASSASAATTTAAPVLTEQELEGVLTSLDEHFAQRASLATNNPTRASSDGRIALSYRRAYADKQSAIANNARAIAGTHAGYSHASSNVQLVSSQQASDGSVELTVQEITTLAFAKVIDAGNDDMSYEAKHVVTLTRNLGVWRIKDIAFEPEYKVFTPITQLPEDVPDGTPDYPVGAPSTFTPPTLPPPEKQGPQVLKGTASSAAVRGSSIASTQAAASYNYSAMIDYAKYWWDKNNKDYPDVSPDNCTNFVSQCLHAGGWLFTAKPRDDKDDHYWYVKIIDGIFGRHYDYSHSWTVAQDLRNFAFISGRAYALYSPWALGVGDILGFDFDKDGKLDHMEIACANNGGDPLMANHISPGYFRKPLSEIMRTHKNTDLWPQRT